MSLLISASSVASSIVLRKKLRCNPADQRISPTCPHWSNTLPTISSLPLFSHLIPNFLKIRIKTCILGNSPWLPQLSLLCDSSRPLMALDFTCHVCLKIYLVMNPSCLASQIVSPSKTKTLFLTLLSVLCPFTCPLLFYLSKGCLYPQRNSLDSTFFADS